MDIAGLSDLAWPDTTGEARSLQERLRRRVVRRDELGPVRRVAGVDAAYPEGRTRVRAAAVVLELPTLELVERSVASGAPSFPYVPGYLSFRELPTVLEALAGLSCRPDVVLCDGHGYAHPRRSGLACHLGVLADVPSVGVAKSRLVGTYTMPPAEKGAWTPLLDDDEVIGAVVRTRAAVKPVFVSVGHRVSLETAVELTLRCTGRYRLPEPTRWADRWAGAGA